MSSILDAPPPPTTSPPPAPPLVFSLSDLGWLAAAALTLVLAAATAVWWWSEPSVGVLIWIGGALVALESWFTGLGYLNRHPAPTLWRRWSVFCASIAPWLVGVTATALAIYAVFALTDWLFPGA